MDINELNFDLSRELITYEPSKNRENNRFLYLNHSKGTVKDCKFDKLPDFLPEKLVIVLKNSKV